jgi:beta-glucanase (GH16 family)
MSGARLHDVRGRNTGWLPVTALLILAASLGSAQGSQLQPVSGGEGWVLAFADEFGGAKLDPGSWTTCYWWNKDGCTNLATKELEWYRPENVKLSGGSLVLEARTEKTVGFEGKEFPYTSGMVTTGRDYEELPRGPRHEFTYGFFEIRAKVPSGRGLWPAAWLLPSNRESKPEIDIMEVLGHRPNVLEMHFHYREPDETSRSVGSEFVTRNLSKDWHVYGCEWAPDWIAWYLDGKEVWRYTDKPFIPREPMYLLLNLAVGGNWPGDPNKKTKFPSRFLIDYVRVWQRGER